MVADPDITFQKAADQFMTTLLGAFESFDPDEVEADLAMGVLTLEFADGSKCIMNRQTAAHQIWLAHGASAWHFAFDAQRGQWLDTKGRGAVETILADLVAAKLRRTITLRCR